MEEIIEEAEVEEEEKVTEEEGKVTEEEGKVTEEEEEVPADNKTSNDEPEVVPEEVKSTPEVEDRKDTSPATEKEVSKPTAVKPVEEVENKLGNWFNKEIRSRIQTTPKGWELRGAG